MKKLLIILAFFATKAQAQVSDSISIKLDTTTYKNILFLIQERIDSKKESKFILEVLSKFEFIATKPKKIK
jgi:hypothetical protein